MKNSKIFRWPGKQGLTPDLEIENFEELSSHATSVVPHKAIFYMTEILTFGKVLFDCVELSNYPAFESTVVTRTKEKIKRLFRDTFINFYWFTNI